MSDVSPSAGLKALEQLRDDACNRIDGARIALTHNIDDPTAASAVAIPEGPGTSGE